MTVKMNFYLQLVCLVLLSASLLDAARSRNNRKGKACVYGCDESDGQVCASDGHTKKSRCHLKFTNCVTKENLTVLHEGECGPYEWRIKYDCDNEDCPSDEDKVCGRDKKTYRNPCELRLANCRSRKEILKKYRGECMTFKPPNDWKNKYDCDDSFCTHEFRKTCGSNGKVYGNRCGLRLANCRSDEEIFEVPNCNYRNPPDVFLPMPRRPRVGYPNVEVDEDDETSYDDLD